MFCRVIFHVSAIFAPKMDPCALHLLNHHSTTLITYTSLTFRVCAWLSLYFHRMCESGKILVSGRQYKLILSERRVAGGWTEIINTRNRRRNIPYLKELLQINICGRISCLPSLSMHLFILFILAWSGQTVRHTCEMVANHPTRLISIIIMIIKSNDGRIKEQDRESIFRQYNHHL